MRVASLVPAVTNMLLELDQGHMLVAVSNYDTDPRVQDLPRAGDLLTMDWEQIAAAHPTHIVVQITETEPGVRGDTATNVTKPAKISTGATVNVPLFINQGEWIKVDTRTRSYTERAKPPGS